MNPNSHIRSIVFIIPFLALLLSACGFKPPTAELTDVRVGKATLLKVNTMLTFRVDNPNSVGATVKSVHYKVFVNNQLVLEDKTDKPVTIPAKGKIDVQIPAGLETQRVAVAGAGLFKERKLDYEIRATVVLDTPAGDMELPVTKLGALRW